jgi:hypothetical protein
MMWSENVPIIHIGNRWSPSTFRSPMAVLLIVVGLPVVANAQPVLEISAPTAGSVINPGQTMTVNVTSPANVTFTKVGVVAESPIGMATTLASGVPAQFSLNIPTNIACRRYMVTADGTTASGQHVSTSVTIDVERPDMPSSIRTLLPWITFEAPGGRFWVKILGSFSGGSVLDVTASSNVVYVSSDATVATVSASGEVRAISAGAAVVTVTYGPSAQGILTTIPVSVPPLSFSIAPAHLDFGEQSVGKSGSLQVTLTNTTRAELGIARITTTGDYSATDTCVSASPIAANATCTITVNFAPRAAGRDVVRSHRERWHYLTGCVRADWHRCDA